MVKVILLQFERILTPPVSIINLSAYKAKIHNNLN